tara:strand:+ start:690 stop:818 length:129 start_codon:yes stop_codon:yes gene_type:complete
MEEENKVEKKRKLKKPEDEKKMEKEYKYYGVFGKLAIELQSK